MARPDLKKKVESALTDLVKKRRTFSLAEVNRYLGPKNKMNFKEIFDIAYPILQKMDVSWHGAVDPIRIVVSAKGPFLRKIHVVQSYFPDFMQRQEWTAIVELFNEKGDIKWVKILGGLLAEYIQRNPELKEADCIVPTPANEEKLQEIGYDPCLLLAKAVSEETNIPIERIFFKTKRTNFCKLKDLEKKQKLVKTAFAIADSDTVRRKHVLLLDDVINSGTTLKSLLNLLRKAEAKKADVLVLNRRSQNN